MDNATLQRFFSLHYLFPFVLAALAVMHLMALHEYASNNPLGVSSKADRMPFHPYYTFKDLVGFFMFFLALSVIVFFQPNFFLEPVNDIPANPLQTPSAMVPEAYLLPFYAILRAIPNKLLGVMAMLASMLVLFAMPLLDTSRVRSTAFRPLMRFIFWSFVVNFLMLGWMGSQHPEPPFLCLGKLSTAFYFAWFLVLVPFIGMMENTLFDLAVDSSKLPPWD